MKLFNNIMNKIIAIFFPWIVSKKKDVKIKALYRKIARLKENYEKKYNYSDKIFSNLNFKFKDSLKNYLNTSMNYVSFNSPKIIDNIKEDFIVPETLIDIKNNNHKTVVSYETIKHESQFYGNDKNKNLIIFISGNERTHPGQKESVKKIMSKIRDCDTLWLSIFNRGLNSKYRSEISFNGLENIYNSKSSEDYILKDNNILKFYKGDNNKINPMSLFLSGNYYLIKNAISKKKYEKVTLAGLSSGCIPTLFYGVFFDEINSILTFDGFTPLTSSYFTPKKGKYFYIYDNKFLEEFDYDTLYFIMLLNKKTKKNLNMFFSDKYWSKSEEILKDLMDKFNFKNFIMENNLKSHDFDEDIILNLIKKNN